MLVSLLIDQYNGMSCQGFWALLTFQNIQEACEEAPSCSHGSFFLVPDDILYPEFKTTQSPKGRLD